MSSCKTSYFLKSENIKSLKDYVKPEVVRDAHGKTLSVGMYQGQRFVRWDKTKGISEYSDVYDIDKQEPWYRYYYNDDISKLIDDGSIYIKYVKPEPVIEEVLEKEHDGQISMF